MTYSPSAPASPAAPTLGRQAVLSARGLVKRRGDTVSLDHASLDIAAGESVAVMGASGSGKTTLLHCLAGIIVPDEGTIRFRKGSDAIEVPRLSDARRSRLRRESFGFVFQQGFLLPELTAIENVALPLMLAGKRRGAAQAEAARWFAPLGLVGLESRRIGQLSGGQAQRVAIARAQVTAAPVVFADEPTGALDSTTSDEVMTLLLASTRSRGGSLVVVTHDPSVAARCDRTILLADGRIVSSDASAANGAVA